MTGNGNAGRAFRPFALLWPTFALFFALLTFRGWISGLQLLAFASLKLFEFLSGRQFAEDACVVGTQIRSID